MTELLYQNWLGYLAPPRRLLPSQWAESAIVLPESANAQPGPLKLTNYQREIVDTFAEPNVHTIVLKLASQTGKSTAIDVLLGYTIDCAPAPILLVHPTESKAFAYIRDRFDPLVAASPVLKSKIGAGVKGVDSKSAKTFPGGSLNVASSHKPDDLAARAVATLFLDECDRFATSAGSEGDPIRLAIKRTRTFRNRKIVISSTPTLRATSRVQQHFERGDQREFFVPCPECGAFSALTPDRLVFEPGKPETARLVCPECNHHAEEAQRIAMVANGSFQATATGEPGVASFHANELISPFSSLESIARQVDAAQTFEAKRVLTNTVFAEPYDSTTEIELFPGDLKQRAVLIQAPYDKAIEFVTAGVDIQSNRIEATILAHAAKGERYVLDHIVLNGDTSADPVWLDLDRLLGQTFSTADKRMLPYSAVAIDSGFGTTRVAEFVSRQRHKGRRVFAIKGVSGFDRPVIRQGAKIKGLTQNYLVGVDGVKLAVQKALALATPQPGFVHLPNHLPEEYFAQLSSERLVTSYVRGYPRQRFEKDPHQRNESLDCMVYASAIATLVKKAAPVAANKPAVSIADRVKALHALHNAA